MCWGETEQQQLGENVEEGVSAFSVRGIQALVAVGNLSCALLATKQPWCWGNGEASLSRVNGIDDAHELAAGGGGVCARIGSGAVACWGERSWLGGHAHVPVPKITNATAIAVGREQVCAITEDLGRSRLYCWKPGEPPREISGY